MSDEDPRLRTSLDRLIIQENELTETAVSRLGSFVKVALDAIGLLNTCIVSMPPGHFLAAASQIALQKSASLAFLSYVRSHMVQGDFNCRQVVEFTCLTGYWIAQPEAHFETTDDPEINVFNPPRKITVKAYNWMKKAYPKLSDDLQDMKNQLNDTVLHANVFTSQITFDRQSKNEDIFQGSFFDNLEPDTVRLNLMKLTGLLLTSIDLVRRASQDHDGFKIASDLDARGQQIEASFAAHYQSLTERSGRRE